MFRSHRLLRVERLESRDVPASNFQILSLTGNNVTAVQHDAFTGDDRGGIALSASQVFVTGDSTTGRFAASNLSGGTALPPPQYDGLTGDLKTQTAYTLGSSPTTPLGFGGGSVNFLLELDASTGALTGNAIPLSFPVFVGFDTGIFAGYERVVLHPFNGSVYEIALPSGTVTVLNSGPNVFTPPHRASDSWAYWGTTEFYGGQNYLDYAENFTTISRQRVSDGAVSAISVLSNLADMATFTVSPSSGRWYFHHEGPSQFYAGNPGDEVVGFADATFQIGDLVVTNLNDAGAGSLRQAIIDSNDQAGTQTIGFSGAASSGTITLTSGDITLTDSVTIAGPGPVTVKGDASNRIFADGSGGAATLRVSGLTLDNPTGFSFPYNVIAAGNMAITAGTGDVAFTKTLSVTAGTLTLTDGNTVDLGPTAMVNGAATAANGFAVGSNETLTGSGNVNGTVTIGSGGKLAGGLTVNGLVTVQSGGTVSPGASPGTVTINGNLQVQADGTLTMELNGPVVGQYDRLIVNGTVALGSGTNLVPTLNFAPSLSDAFVLIVNDAGDAIGGTLNGVRNHSGLKIGGVVFQVRYDSGTGNDVVLLVNDAPILNTGIATSFTTLLEDVPPASNLGSSIDSLVATEGLYSDADGLFRSGLALTAADTTGGVWQLSRDGGGSWAALGILSPTSATLLEADGAGQNRVRFLPNTDYFGTSSLSFKGWDATDGNADGSIGVDVSANGANASYSAGTETAGIQVLAVNDAPVAGADSYSVNEDDVLTKSAAEGVLANDTDVDGPFPLTATVADAPVHGTLVLDPDGGYTYTPFANYNGPDAFTYRVADGKGVFDVGTVSLTVAPVNDNPVAADDTATSVEDGGAISADVLANDTSAPDVGETLTITAVSDPANGTATIIGGGKSISYNPDPNYNGPDSFTYTISDGNGGTATATVNVTVTSTNDPPDAIGDSADLNEDGGAQTIDVLANDLITPDSNETLTVGSVTQGLHGTVAIGPGGLTVTYTPNTDYAGPDAFIYTVSDGNGGSDFAAVSVNVINDAADRLELVTSTGTLVFTEGDAAKAVDPAIRVGSALEGVITSATVKITSGFVAKKDTLVFVNQNGIKGTFSKTTGVLTLKGPASPATYQDALRSVQFVNLSPAPVDGVRTVAFQIKDVAGTGDPATKLVRVIGVNTKPILTLTSPAANYTRGKPGVAVAGNLKIKDVDNTRLLGATVKITTGFAANQDALTFKTKTGITAIYDGATGTLTLTGNATIATYLAVLKTVKFSTPAAAPAGARSIVFTVNDGLLDSDSVTRTVNVV
jgi:large repetitive protein